ncbi:MAG: DUF362 domain-containing protein [Desulfobacteraceae bacterium]|nr:DUF362 domain-containing protein [Desulfobacteraceae bacterium]
MVPTRRHGFNYMQELHTSPHQRKMIAEINAPFSPDLIILDGIEAFVDGGPAEGKRAQGVKQIRKILLNSDEACF